MLAFLGKYKNIEIYYSIILYKHLQVTNQKYFYRIESLTWPGNSLYLNPVENCWHYMGKGIREKRRKSLKEMKKIIEAVWNEEINKSYFQRLIHSMPKRIAEVIRRRVCSTKY